MRNENIKTESYTETRKIKIGEKIICDICGCVFYDTMMDLN